MNATQKTIFYNALKPKARYYQGGLIEGENISQREFLEHYRKQNKYNGENNRLAIVDSFGNYYTLTFWTTFENMRQNFEQYKKLLAQLQKSNPNRIVMFDGTKGKDYIKTYKIVYLRQQ